MKVNKYIIIILGIIGLFLLPFCGEDLENIGLEEECVKLECVHGFFVFFNGQTLICECDCEEGWFGELCDEEVEVEECEELACVFGTFNEIECECDCEEGWFGELCNVCAITVPNLQNLQGRLCTGESCSELLASGEFSIEDFYGLEYKGGIIFDIDTDLGYCKIMANDPVAFGFQWGCYGSYLGTSVNGVIGYEATLLIFNECGGVDIQIINNNAVETPNTAAAVCILRGDIDGREWYLPSIEEFEIMQQNLFNNNLGSLLATNYWTSYDVDELHAFRWNFEDGEAHENDKNGKFLVQPILLIVE